MRARFYLVAVLSLVTLAGALFAFQRRGRGGFGGDFGGGGFGGGFGGDEARIALTPLYQDEKTEWAFTRLAYGGYGGGFGGYGGRGRGRGRWMTDGPKSDHQFVVGVQRLTRLHSYWGDVKAVEPGSEDVFDSPWIYAVEVGSWGFTQEEADNMRKFLLRGGFLMVDDFHGDYEWESFLEGMRMIFPDREIEELPETDEIYHVAFDVHDRLQIANYRVGYGYPSYEKGGIIPRWRAIRDDRGRIMVAICHNMDLGDAWEWADDPHYPQPMALQAYQMGINYILYAMTH